MIEKAQATVDQIAKHYKMRSGSPMRSVTTRLSKTWEATDKELTKALLDRS